MLLGLCAASVGVMLLAAQPAATQNAPKKLICYYTNWARYRSPLANFTPKNINPYLCSHIHYFLANSDDKQKLGPSDPFSDITQKGYEQFNELKNVNPQLKTMLSLGGTGSRQQEKFQDLGGNRAKMRRFAMSVISYLRTHGFSGIDIDWKEPQKKEDHAELLETLMDSFTREAARSGKERLLLSVTLPSDIALVQRSFDIPRIMAASDYSIILMYNFHSSSANVTGHHEPLFSPRSEDTPSASSVVNAYRDLGAQMDKVVMGVATFGITFTLEDADDNGLGAPAVGPGFKGKLTLGSGTLAFYEVCEHVSMDGWEAFRPQPGVLGPYAVKGNQWVAYDDEQMMRRKGQYVRDIGLGGAAVWTLDLDDFRGFCTGRPYPLTEALKEGMFGVQGAATTTTPAPPTTPMFDNTPVFSCPGPGKFPKLDDCTKFLFCEDGVAEVTDCPEGQMFDAVREACSAEALCTPQVSMGVTMFKPTGRPEGPDEVIVVEPPVTQSTPPSSGDMTSPPRPPTPQPTSVVIKSGKMMMDKEVRDPPEVEELLRLVENLGGIEGLKTLLQGRTPTAAPIITPLATTQTIPISSLGGSLRGIRVHVVVELVP